MYALGMTISVRRRKGVKKKEREEIKLSTAK